MAAPIRRSGHSLFPLEGVEESQLQPGVQLLFSEREILAEAHEQRVPGKRCHPDPDPRREGDDALSGFVTAQADLPVQFQESLHARGKVVQRGEIVVEFGLELFARVLVEGPFQAADGIEGGPREAILGGCTARGGSTGGRARTRSWSVSSCTGEMLWPPRPALLRPWRRKGCSFPTWIRLVRGLRRPNVSPTRDWRPILSEDGAGE